MMADKYHPDFRQLDELDAKISSARKEMADEVKFSEKPELSKNLVGLAMRAGVELVAGVAVGAGVGYALDIWLGSGPWLLIVCFIVGAAAGMLNVYRAVNGLGMAVGYKKSLDDK
tara:strand:+ start:21 stop:365 length:345 start_codon:yes stop_codon:yes gene_type:complete